MCEEAQQCDEAVCEELERCVRRRSKVSHELTAILTAAEAFLV